MIAATKVQNYWAGCKLDVMAFTGGRTTTEMLTGWSGDLEETHVNPESLFGVWAF